MGFCGEFMCDGHDNTCWIADEIKNQRQHGADFRGGWTREAWASKIKSGQEALLVCQHPDQLTAALAIDPPFVEDKNSAQPTSDS